VPYFVVFQAPTGRWVARGPFPTRAAAEAGRPRTDDIGSSDAVEIVEASHGVAAAHAVFKKLHLPGYRS
jgi:hypothetical protein